MTIAFSKGLDFLIAIGVDYLNDKENQKEARKQLL